MSYQSVGVTGVTTFNKIPEYARGILEHSSNFQNCIKSTNKIPLYAREYKKEYLFIIGINKEFKYFVDHINDATKGLFERQKVDRVKYLIKRFLRGQERGKLKDISNFEIESNDVKNLIEIKKNFDNFNEYINFCYDCSDDDDDEYFIDRYPGFKNIYDDFELFYSKLNIKNKDFIFVCESDIEDFNITFSESDIEDFNIILHDCVSDIF